jgi:hypothetical protein
MSAASSAVTSSLLADDRDSVSDEVDLTDPPPIDWCDPVRCKRAKVSQKWTIRMPRQIVEGMVYGVWCRV